MKKTILSLLIMTLLVGSIFSGCGTKNTEETLSDGEKYTITVGYPNADESWEQDEYFKYINDKIGIDIDFKALSGASAGEKARIWISSGSMPDIVYSDFMMDEYKKYGKQGMVRKLPDDWETKYPNVGFSVAMTGVLSELKNIDNGAMYGLLRPLDFYGTYLDEFRKAYAEGKDLREMMNDPKYVNIDNYGFVYRKDWAKQLGIKTDYIMKYEDFIEMARKFKEADLGNVGEKNTVGITVDYTEAPNIFITAFNSSYKYFHKDENGRYVCGLLEDSTAEGVKAYTEAYRTGILAPDFYTQKTQDLNSVFCSQRSGVIFPKADTSAQRVLKADFAKANPGIDPDEAIGVCWILSPDGKVHGRRTGNYNGIYYFNPDIPDAKFAKILELADYVSSPEGGPQVRLGVPGVDYDENYNNIREKNQAGTWDVLNEKYPSNLFFRNFLNPQYSQTTDLDPKARAEATALREAKLSNELSLLSWDVERDSYVADDYVKFNAAYEVNAMFAEIIASEGDVAKLWEAKRAEIAKAAKSVEENMNKALLK